MTKYAANALLATRISFMNEIANLCERVGADVELVRRGIGLRPAHRPPLPLPRRRATAARAFPKDVQAVIHTAHEHGMKFPLLNAVEEVNDAQKRRLVEKVVAEFGEELAGPAVRASGASPSSRRPTTCARRRRSPSSRGCSTAARSVAVHDPEALGEARKVFGERVTYHRVNYDALARRRRAAHRHRVERVPSSRLRRA